MAVTIAISFLLIIPIEPIVWLLTVPSGLLIGYYANQRSNRRAGPWRRIIVNGVFAALITGLATAVLLLGVKALFFYGDNGYRDPSAGGPITCTSGPDCVYQRYRIIEDGARVPGLEAAGVTDAESFSAFYWSQQFTVAGLIVAVTTAAWPGWRPALRLCPPKAAPPKATEPVATARP